MFRLYAFLALLLTTPALAAGAFPTEDFLILRLHGSGSTGDVSGMSVTPSGTSTASALSSRASRDLNVIDDFGAKGDCLSDDSGAFNNAVAALVASAAKGGRLHVPTPPGGCYIVNSPVVLLGQAAAPYKYSVEIYGDGPATIIRAGAAIDSVLQKDSTYNRGYAVHNLTLDANQVATHALHLYNGAENRFYQMWFINAAPGGSNVKFESAAGENFLTDSFVQNDPGVITTPSNVPSYDLDVESSDNHFVNDVFWNALACNVYDNGSDNHYLGTHAYGYPSTYVSPYNFCANKASVYSGNTADTSSAAGFNVSGYGAQFSDNKVINAPVGFLVANGVQDVKIVGNWTDATTVTAAVQQAGSPGANTIVAFNAGASPVYSNFGALLSGANQTTSSNILGWLGSYGSVNGAGSFCLGNNANDEYRLSIFCRSSGSNSYNGDAQVFDVVQRASGASGTVKIVTNGANAAYQNNEIRVRLDIPGGEDVSVKLHAFCSTLDYADWTVNFGLAANKTAASVEFEGASGLTTTPPIWTTVRASSGASSWTPAVVLDTTNGGAYLTGTGTCTGGKTIYWVADVHVVETGAGTN